MITVKRFKTKKAFTLVELVVTVAILSITAGFGIGIFASAMSNYSKASLTAKEQALATEIEDFILDNARICTNLYLINSDYSEDFTEEGYYANNAAQVALDNSDSYIMSMASDSGVLKLTTNERGKETDVTGAVVYSDIIDQPDLTVSGVDHIDLTLCKQKMVAGQTEKQSFNYLQYSIYMNEGYFITGDVMLYSCKNLSFVYENGFFEKADEGTITIGGEGNASTNGIAFVVK